MRKVLIALDYGQTAQKVAETGFELAKSMRAEVTILHVVAQPLYYLTSEVYFPMMGFSGFMDIDLQKDTQLNLKITSQNFLEHTKKHLDDEAIKTLVMEGDSADAILSAATELNADVIVLGSHSRRWLEEILLGSVTEKVLHKSSIPLFIIPTRKHK